MISYQAKEEDVNVMVRFFHEREVYTSRNRPVLSDTLTCLEFVALLAAKLGYIALGNLQMQF